MEIREIECLSIDLANVCELPVFVLGWLDILMVR